MNKFKKMETKLRMSIGKKKVRHKQILPVKDTKPEKMMQLALQLHHIEFEKHKTIKITETSYHQVDIFIKPNICIEINGCYWHYCPTCFRHKQPNDSQLKTIQRDRELDSILTNKGYYTITIWEHDIVKSTEKEIVDNIISLLKQKITIGG